jgi:hypothetical protein
VPEFTDTRLSWDATALAATILSFDNAEVVTVIPTMVFRDVSYLDARYSTFNQAHRDLYIM